MASLSRHFAKEDLPRISYVNQNIKIDVKRKDHVDPFEPIMTVSLGEVDILVSHDGTDHPTLQMTVNRKQSI